jgi:hypothetical protein
LVSKKAKEGKTKKPQSGHPGKQRVHAAIKQPFAWLACDARREKVKGYADIRSEEERNGKWVFSSNLRLLKLCPCPHIDY